MKWNLRLVAAQRGTWTASELKRLLADRGMVISSGKMSGLWSGQPASIKFADLEVLDASPGRAPPSRTRHHPHRRQRAHPGDHDGRPTRIGDRPAAREAKSCAAWTRCLPRSARSTNPLDPVMPLAQGSLQSPPGAGTFNAFSDSAPDRWGRTLLRRAERRRARCLGETPRSPREADYVLGVRDDVRQGAVRFRRPGDPQFLSRGPDAGAACRRVGGLTRRG